MSSARLSIFCVGDSRTVGNFSTELGGYRFGLFNAVRNKIGYAPRFLGSDAANAFFLPLCGASGDKTADCNTKITTQAPLFSNASFVLIDIGVNDAIIGTAAATIASNTNAIVDIARTYSPNATIIVAKTCDYSGFNAEVVAYNAALTTTISQRADYSASPAVAKTSLYDLYSDIGTYSGTYFANAGHLNAAGYAIEASGWYNKMVSLL